MQQRALTRFLTLKTINSQQIHSELLLVSGDALAFSTTQKWHIQERRSDTFIFSRGEETL
jgi:hypothetical protein